METYDKNPIMGDGYTFRSWRFSLRELILGLLAGGLLISCVFLAGFLGKSSSDLQQAQTGALAAQIACKGSTCLRTSAHIVELLNTSMDPCDNFYTFACGGYRVKNPVDKYTLFQSIKNQMYQNNQDQLLAILNSPTKRYMSWSAERKAKDFFNSCLDSFQREQLKGKPLLDKVFPMLGGWYVKDGASWNQDTFDLNRVLQVVHNELGLDAMFSPRPYPDARGSKKQIIRIYPGGKGRYMSWRDYTDNPTDKQRKLQQDYKSFMRTVAQLIARDAGLPVSSDRGLANRIDVFADDVYQVESALGKFASNSEYQNPYRETSRVSLSDLNQKTGGPIDWTEQMQSLFNEARVTGNTKVVIPYPTYLTNLTAMIRGLDQAARNRQLHNYLTWRVLETYISDLSWDYVHANRQFYVDKYGYANFQGTKRYCFGKTKQKFNIALGALYVQARFDMRNKNKVTEITEALKMELEDMINKNNWMDQATKKYAIDKMKGSTYKLGYPDFMTDEGKVDGIYSELSINRTDHLGNILQCNKQHNRQWNKLLREGDDLDDWVYNTYTTNLAIKWSWDEIIVPAGILRFPMYEFDMPHYYSFGAFGTILGRVVHKLIDESGRIWDKGGHLMKAKEGWWTNQTVQNYNNAKQCVADLYNNVTQGPYISYNGDEIFLSVSGIGYAREAIAVITGIRMAYNAYQTWQQKYGQDSTSPGLPYNPLQLFFIAHAQIQCYNRDPVYDYMYARYGVVHRDVRVNLAYKELPEFRQAFQCKATDNMVSAKPCTYV